MRYLYLLALVGLLILGCLPEKKQVTMELPPCNSTPECPDGLLCCLDGVCRESCSMGRLEPDLMQTELLEDYDVDAGGVESDALPGDTGSLDMDPDTAEPDSQNLDVPEDTSIEPDEVGAEDTEPDPDEITAPDIGPDSEPDIPNIEWSCTGDICIDTVYGLMWEQDSPDLFVVYADAEAHCAGLLLGGHSDWRVPTVTELRTLIRGCPGTESDGTCALSEYCTVGGCNNYACQGCAHYGGPGPDGCYWPDDLGGSLKCFQNWSATTGPPEEELDHIHWNVGFYEAFVHGVVEDNDVAMPRCVRGM